MKKLSLIALVLTASVIGTQAKSWKVGPSSVVGMDFASINDAMSKVSAGDTLYLDQYYNESNEQTITKRVVIIGTGYDTSLTDEQVVATLTNSLTLKANNIEVRSLRLNNDVNFYSKDCVIARCYVAGLMKHQTTTAGMNHIYSCYITGRIEGYSSSEPSMQDVQNCVIVNNEYGTNSNLLYLTSSIINNNVIYKYYSIFGNGVDWCYTLAGISNTQITNNFVYGCNGSDNRDLSGDVVASGSGNSIEHNVFSGTASMINFPTNITGQKDNWESFFVCEGNYSDYYRLSTEMGDNPCINYATDGGEVGCHGGMFGCPSGGRPQYIPYFTKVTVGSRVENGKLPVSVTIKIQDE